MISTRYGFNHLCNPTPAATITQKDKCGYGPRIPLLIISPYAKENFVEYSQNTDFTSILKFIEDNWNLGQIGGGSLDYKANSLNNMFEFKSPNYNTLILNPLGTKEMRPDKVTKNVTRHSFRNLSHAHIRSFLSRQRE